MLTTSYLFPQLWATFATKLMKRPTVFLNISKLQLHFYMFTKFVDQQIKIKMLSVSICEQNLVYSSNFEQYFPQKLWKTVQFLCIFKVWFNLYSVTQFYHDHIFTTKMTSVSTLLTNCYLFQRAYSLPSVFKIFFDLPYTFPDICNFH